MTSNTRTKIAAGATVLGLGGLAGLALATNDGQSAAAGQTAQGAKPMVHTEVVHRTVHVRSKAGSEEGAASPPPITGTGGGDPSTYGDSFSSDESDELDEHEGDDQDAYESDEHESEDGDD